MDFSTLNESSLHNTLKNYYTIQTNGKTEVKLHNHIYDIYTETNQVIEIQTQNLAKILPKILDTLEKNIKVKVVFPLVTEKRIIVTDEKQNIISKRKSPKKNCIYQLFSELTGFYPALLHKNFTLEVLLTHITEERIKTDKPVQSKNNRRRFNNKCSRRKVWTIKKISKIRSS